MNMRDILLAKALSGGGSGGEVPFFDFAEMGLPAIAAGSAMSADMDTSAVIAALNRGPVKFRCIGNMGVDIPLEGMACAFYMPTTQTYQLTSLGYFSGSIMAIIVTVTESYVSVRIAPVTT